jgi:hypothetical protein
VKLPIQPYPNQEVGATSSPHDTSTMAQSDSDGSSLLTVSVTNVCNDCRAIPFLCMLNNLHTTTGTHDYESMSTSRVYKESLSVLQTAVDCSLCGEISAQLVAEIQGPFQLDPSDFKDTPVTVSLKTIGNLYNNRAVGEERSMLGYISAWFFCHLDGMKIPGRLPATIFQICVPGGESTDA